MNFLKKFLNSISLIITINFSLLIIFYLFIIKGMTGSQSTIKGINRLKRFQLLINIIQLLINLATLFFYLHIMTLPLDKSAVHCRQKGKLCSSKTTKLVTLKNVLKF